MSALRLPSARATAALAGGMLALGVAIGAAIGPAPDASLAGASRLPLLLPALSALATAGSVGHQTAAAVRAPAINLPATPQAAGGSSLARSTSTTPPPPSAAASPTSSSPQTAPTPSNPTTPRSRGGQTTTLPPVTNVWLIELSGTTFADALAQPAAAPYIDGQAIPGGALLADWSAVEGSAFASEAALLASAPPQLLDTIVQPPCPEGVAGTQCAVGTPAGTTAADEFLKRTVATITSTVAYRSHGLIVVTFASVASAAATELPSGASTATLISEPPAGVLLISPLASAGTRPSTTTFNPASPRLSLERLLHR